MKLPIPKELENYIFKSLELLWKPVYVDEVINSLDVRFALSWKSGTHVSITNITWNNSFYEREPFKSAIVDFCHEWIVENSPAYKIMQDHINQVCELIEFCERIYDWKFLDLSIKKEVINHD